MSRKLPLALKALAVVGLLSLMSASGALADDEDEERREIGAEQRIVVDADGELVRIRPTIVSRVQVNDGDPSPAVTISKDGRIVLVRPRVQGTEGVLRLEPIRVAIVAEVDEEDGDDEGREDAPVHRYRIIRGDNDEEDIESPGDRAVLQRIRSQRRDGEDGENIEIEVELEFDESDEHGEAHVRERHVHEHHVHEHEDIHVHEHGDVRVFRLHSRDGDEVEERVIRLHLRHADDDGAGEEGASIYRSYDEIEEVELDVDDEDGERVRVIRVHVDHDDDDAGDQGGVWIYRAHGNVEGLELDGENIVTRVRQIVGPEVDGQRVRVIRLHGDDDEEVAERVRIIRLHGNHDDDEGEHAQRRYRFRWETDDDGHDDDGHDDDGDDDDNAHRLRRIQWHGEGPPMVWRGFEGDGQGRAIQILVIDGDDEDAVDHSNLVDVLGSLNGRMLMSTGEDGHRVRMRVMEDETREHADDDDDDEGEFEERFESLERRLMELERKLDRLLDRR